jgi:hypothetical protein
MKCFANFAKIAGLAALESPPSSFRMTATEALAYPAVELFVERVSSSPATGRQHCGFLRKKVPAATQFDNVANARIERATSDDVGIPYISPKDIGV